jgi:hypothetical protein
MSRVEMYVVRHCFAFKDEVSKAAVRPERRNMDWYSFDSHSGVSRVQVLARVHNDWRKGDTSSMMSSRSSSGRERRLLDGTVGEEASEGVASSVSAGWASLLDSIIML